MDSRVADAEGDPIAALVPVAIEITRRHLGPGDRRSDPQGLQATRPIDRNVRSLDDRDRLDVAAEIFRHWRAARRARGVATRSGR
jgi:hypothetical protein